MARRTTEWNDAKGIALNKGDDVYATDPAVAGKVNYRFTKPDGTPMIGVALDVKTRAADAVLSLKGKPVANMAVPAASLLHGTPPARKPRASKPKAVKAAADDEPSPARIMSTADHEKTAQGRAFAAAA